MIFKKIFLDALPFISKNCHSCCGITSHSQLKSVTLLVCSVSTENSHKTKFLPFCPLPSPPPVCHVLQSSLVLQLSLCILWSSKIFSQAASHSLLSICHSEYVSLVTAEDCWYPFSFRVTTVLCNCFAMPLCSLSKGHHPNFCIQFWSQCGIFSKA